MSIHLANKDGQYELMAHFGLKITIMKHQVKELTQR